MTARPGPAALVAVAVVCWIAEVGLAWMLICSIDTIHGLAVLAAYFIGSLAVALLWRAMRGGE